MEQTMEEQNGAVATMADSEEITQPAAQTETPAAQPEAETNIAPEAAASDAALADENRRLSAQVTALEIQLEEARNLSRRDENELSTMRASLDAAVASYRELLLADAPDAAKDLVSGDTVEQLDSSFARAKRVVDDIRRGLETELANRGAPAGAPIRSAAIQSSLSARQKIQAALERQ